MRRALTALVVIAIVVVGCAPASTPKPTPTRVLSSDEAYLQYTREVVGNDLRAYMKLVLFIFDAAAENPWVVCSWLNELEDAAKNVKYASELTPKPGHPLLEKEHAYMLEAMERQLDAVWYFDKGCASQDLTAMERGFRYQKEVPNLLGYGNDAFDEYMRSQ